LTFNCFDTIILLMTKVQKNNRTKKSKAKQRTLRKYSNFSNSKLLAVAIVVAVIGIALIIKSFAAAPVSSKLYRCAKRNPNAAAPPSTPALPSQPQAADAAVVQSYQPVCAAGEVPIPKATQGPKRIPKGLEKQGRTNTALEPRSSIGGYYYSWSVGSQNVSGQSATDLYAQQSNERPYYSTAPGSSSSGHSLGQIWAIDSSDPRGLSTIEEGWSVSPGQFGDTNPHLFIYHFDAGVGMGYAPAGGWVQVSNTVYPNMRLSYHDRQHSYYVQAYAANWWVSYDGIWVGYYPASAFPRHFPAFLTRIDAGGEVATLEQRTCTDMGHGSLLGTDANAARFGGVWWGSYGNIYAHTALLYPLPSDPNQYNIGNWTSGQPGYTFRYGGPGWC
jgi:hypothetical protein